MGLTPQEDYLLDLAREGAKAEHKRREREKEENSVCGGE